MEIENKSTQEAVDYGCLRSISLSLNKMRIFHEVH